jgi:hypothetical protein
LQSFAFSLVPIFFSLPSCGNQQGMAGSSHRVIVLASEESSVQRQSAILQAASDGTADVE